MEKKLKRISNIKDVPFFGAVLSETGSGKTIGGARIMKSVSKNLRFTLALGLRSLTLQSGKSYQENLKLHDHHVATIIGSTITKSLFELEDKEGEEQLFRVLSISDNLIELRLHNDARPSTVVRKIKKARTVCTYKAFFDRKARKVLVDPLGKTLPAHD